MKHKKYFDLFCFLVSGLVLLSFLTAAINNVNSSIVERDKKIISEIHSAIENLKASEPSLNAHAMNYLPEVISPLFSLGVKISVFAVVYLILSYVAWLIFKKSYSRLEDTFYNWLDE